jgi:hypothetical protein
MSDQREAPSPPRGWQGDIEIEVRAAGASDTLTLREATRADWDAVRAALAEAAGRHAYRKAARERGGRPPRSTGPSGGGRRSEPTPVEPDDEPEPGHTGPSTGHS